MIFGFLRCLALRSAANLSCLLGAIPTLPRVALDLSADRTYMKSERLGDLGMGIPLLEHAGDGISVMLAQAPVSLWHCLV